MRKTKTEIYGTLGPACSDYKTIHEMISSGMSGMRLNLSHTSLSESRDMLKNWRQAADDLQAGQDLLIDMQGPQLRTGIISQPLTLKENSICILGRDIPVSETVIESVQRNDEILIDDGKILLQAVEKTKEGWQAEVIRGGILTSRKSLKVAEKNIYGPILTEADRASLQQAEKYGVTAVMQPFVRNGKDLSFLRQTLNENGCGRIRIFAKIENREGMQHLNEIMKEADMIVIARGDLGNDMPLWQLPAAQKEIERQCRVNEKPFMVVTQMLASMVNNPVPTRAEVNDVFNAVADGASAIMVTNETAAGHYPAEVMRYLVNTAVEAEKYLQGSQRSVQ